MGEKMSELTWIGIVSIEFFAVVLIWQSFFEKSKHPKLYFVLLYLLFVLLLNPNYLDYAQMLNGNFDWILKSILEKFGFN